MVYILHNVTDRVEFTLNLKSQKLYYQALVKNIPVAVATLKLDRRIVDCNPAFEALFGYTLEEVKGRSLDPLITPPDKLEASPARLDSIAPGEFIREVTMRRRKDGSLVEVEAYRVPVTMRGKRIAILCLYYDISRLGLTRQPPIELLEQADLSPAMTELPPPGAESLLAEPLQVTAPQSEAVEMVKAAPTRRGRSPKASLPETRQLEEEPGTPSAAGYEVNRIEGIGPAYAKRLTEVGITTTADLLAACLTRDGRTQLSEQTGISTNLLLVWASRADLMRVPGVGAEYCDLLDASGVDTSEELRVRNPEILHQTLLEVNQTWQLTKRNPTLAEVSDWIAAAKNIDVFISY
jgi:PAS domain S-box-containing protein